MLLLDDPLLGDGGKKYVKISESPKQDEDNEKELNSLKRMRREEEEYVLLNLPKSKGA